mmetsp:Transcript_21393/g.29939  ORF Transcript_21393/g.29939 Transcript_21393/m.29939 type:complete len:153 (-) Transcript_21393:913-1371(-)
MAVSTILDQVPSPFYSVVRILIRRSLETKVSGPRASFRFQKPFISLLSLYSILRTTGCDGWCAAPVACWESGTNIQMKEGKGADPWGTAEKKQVQKPPLLGTTLMIEIAARDGFLIMMPLAETSFSMTSYHPLHDDYYRHVFSSYPSLLTMF